VARSYNRSKGELKKIFLTPNKSITPSKLIDLNYFSGEPSDVVEVNLLLSLSVSEPSNLSKTSIECSEDVPNKQELELRADCEVLKIRVLAL
jgi:hypothetical protein